MLKDTEITEAALTHKTLWYSPEFGNFYRGGKRAGFLHTSGYRRIRYKGQQYPEHRLAFIIMGGAISKEYDHINRVRDDNRWCNIRPCTTKENAENRHNNNRFAGVSWDKRYNKWQVRSSRSAPQGMIALGYFKTHIAACYARWSYDKR